MKKFFFLILLVSIFANGQNKRFIYEYSYILDSTNKSSVEKEMLVLDVTSAGSKFYSYERYKSDSIVLVELEKQKHSNSEFINFDPSYQGKITYAISKIYPKFNLYMHNDVGNNRYQVADDRKMLWKILPEKQKIGEFETQKAETEMFGRKWIAWFTTEIPIQDGPYKFHSLPGLIVKIENSDQTHTFQLKGITNFLENNREEVEAKLSFQREIQIDYKKYKKLFNEHYSDPTKSLRELMATGDANFKIFDSDGVEVDPADMLRRRALEAKEARKKNNNFLELDLLN